MRIELICVGTELLSDKINTHISYVGEKLKSIGLELKSATTVSDNFEDMLESFAGVFEKADIAIITGGLGPTFDDLTREAVSKILQKELIFDRKSMKNIARIFANYNIDMPKSNEKQAFILQGAAPIENKLGTAPGQIIKVDNKKFAVKTIILMPGPKKELAAMLDHSVLPALKKEYTTKIIKSKVIRVFGMSESKANDLIKPVVETERKFEGNTVSFTILAHMSIIDIKTTATGNDELLVDEILHNISSELSEVLGDNIFGEGAQTLERVVAGLLSKNRKSLSIAESCTGGLISSKLTDVPGSSSFFKEGIVAYSNSSKIDLLKVPEEILEKYGAVSEQTAIKMAHGVKELSRSDYSLGVTGIAGPSGGTESKPVGTVCFAVVTPAAEKSCTQNFIGNRTEIKERSSLFALNLLRKELIQPHNFYNKNKNKKLL